MARSDKLYTNPRSKAGDEPDKREAKKGDVMVDDGTEYESMGTNDKRDEGGAISEKDVKEWKAGSGTDKPHIGRRDGLKMEYWRPKKKKDAAEE